MLIYANLCKYRRHRSRDGSRPIRMSPCGAPGDSMTAKQCLGAIIGDDTLRPLVTVSLQNGVIYANLCK